MISCSDVILPPKIEGIIASFNAFSHLKLKCWKVPTLRRIATCYSYAFLACQIWTPQNTQAHYTTLYGEKGAPINVNYAIPACGRL